MNEVKQKVLDTTRGLMQAQGYNATGLNQIIKESGTPKGSLYHYFPGGKEQLASEAIQLAAQELGQKLATAFEHSESLIQAFEAIVDVGIQELIESDFECGCPIATVALEANEGPVLEACQTAFRGAQKLLESRLLLAGYEADQAQRLATFMFGAYEGALILSRTHRDVSPLRGLKDMLPAVLEI
jgi:TetR/AcrR family transcriptional repressor of lmrAB and yxaGH operons